MMAVRTDFFPDLALPVTPEPPPASRLLEESASLRRVWLEETARRPEEGVGKTESRSRE
jgi:hypothetical protein